MTEEQLLEAWVQSLKPDAQSEPRLTSEPEPESEPQRDLTDRERARKLALEFQMREVISGIDAAWRRRERRRDRNGLRRQAAAEMRDLAVAELRRQPQATINQIMDAIGVSYGTVKRARKFLRDEARASRGFTTARGHGNVSTNR